jgi:hypothetical protein
MAGRRGIALLADVPDGRCRDGPPELVIRGKDAVIPDPSPRSMEIVACPVSSIPADPSSHAGRTVPKPGTAIGPKSFREVAW